MRFLNSRLIQYSAGRGVSYSIVIYPGRYNCILCNALLCIAHCAFIHALTPVVPTSSLRAHLSLLYIIGIDTVLYLAL